MCYVYANPHVHLSEGIYLNQNTKPFIEDLDNIIQDFKTVRLGL